MLWVRMSLENRLKRSIIWFGVPFFLLTVLLDWKEYGSVVLLIGLLDAFAFAAISFLVDPDD